jgi:hypothetical protein
VVDHELLRFYLSVSANWQSGYAWLVEHVDMYVAVVGFVMYDDAWQRSLMM